MEAWQHQSYGINKNNENSKYSFDTAPMTLVTIVFEKILYFCRCYTSFVQLRLGKRASDFCTYKILDVAQIFKRFMELKGEESVFYSYFGALKKNSI